jgi:fibro-slime domain-containing protein
MSDPKPSKFLTPTGRVLPATLLVSCLALPLMLSGLTGCGGESGDSRVGSAASSSTGSTPGAAGFGGPDIILPGEGGTGNGTGGTGNGSGGAGPYMLPADYTKASLGGFKLGAPIDVGSAPGAAGAPSSGCGTAILGVVRDFKGKNEMGGHPDFEAYAGRGASKGIVKDTLGDDKKPVYNGSGPIIDAKNGQQTTSKMDFDQWYRGTKDVNKAYEVYFYFEPSNGVLTFQSNAFFPLDGKGWGNTPKWEHDFGFTTEVHTQFNYRGKETFKFTGDDDLWVFINHKLAIDLGGLHPQESDEISLDAQAQRLGITIGQNYDLDLFHAERHTDQSNFRVDTNLAFVNCGTIIQDQPVK